MCRDQGRVWRSHSAKLLWLCRCELGELQDGKGTARRCSLANNTVL